MDNGLEDGRWGRSRWNESERECCCCCVAGDGESRETLWISVADWEGVLLCRGEVAFSSGAAVVGERGVPPPHWEMKDSTARGESVYWDLGQVASGRELRYLSHEEPWQRRFNVWNGDPMDSRKREQTEDSLFPLQSAVSRGVGQREGLWRKSGINAKNKQASHKDVDGALSNE